MRTIAILAAAMFAAAPAASQTQQDTGTVGHVRMTWVEGAEDESRWEGKTEWDCSRYGSRPAGWVNIRNVIGQADLIPILAHEQQHVERLQVVRLMPRSAVGQRQVARTVLALDGEPGMVRLRHRSGEGGPGGHDERRHPERGRSTVPRLRLRPERVPGPSADPIRARVHGQPLIEAR